MSETRRQHERVREIVTENAQKGELYRLQFKNDPITYVGLPVALSGVTSSYDESFEFKVLEPADRRGLHRRSVREVEWLEKIR